MRWTQVLALGAVASIAATAACGAPASKTAGSTDTSTPKEAEKASAGLMPDAKGPAPEVPGAKKGGTLTISYSTVPSGMDPSSQFYQDSASILKLTNRALTTFALIDGKSVLVPDLATDLGKASADGMDWTYTLKDGLKYEDGTAVKAEDVAYAIKRSFAQEELPGGPTYQNDFFKGGDTYKGPYKSGDNFQGVSTPDDKTVVIHLRRKFETLPYFVSFSQFSPIPKAKDTKQNYSNHPIATGPYMFKSFTQGTQLQLVKNPNWDPNTDPARHQYVDGYTFNFGGDTVKTQQAILASNGPDATTLNWEAIDAQFVDQVTGPKKSQFVSGPSSCTVGVNLDTRKMPLPVRKALAVAYPFDLLRKAAGLTTMSAVPATTLIPPQVPGHLDYTLPGLTGTGKGDPVAAKKMLADAGKTGFQLDFYYTNDDPIAQQVNLVHKQALEAAGFKVHDMGVPGKERRALIGDPKSPTNMLQGPGGWCFDWPSGDAIFPPTVSSTVMKAGGTGWGNLSDAKVDAEIARISALSIAEQGPEWGKFDKWLMETYLPVLPYYWDKGNFVFGTKVHNVVDDPNHGMPFLEDIWVDQ